MGPPIFIGGNPQESAHFLGHNPGLQWGRRFSSAEIFKSGSKIF